MLRRKARLLLGLRGQHRVTGVRTGSWSAASSTRYSTDILGRITFSEQTTVGGSSPFEFRYEYNADGSLKRETYPSGRVLTMGYDTAGRVNAVSGQRATDTTNYLSGVDYAAHGGYASLQMGNGKMAQWCYNSRLQLTAARMGASASTGCAASADELLRLEFGYAAGANNGNLATQRVAFPALGGMPALDLMQAYSYDPLNRISRVEEGTESRDFGYDAFGNMWVPAASAGFARQSFTPATSAWFDNKNRLTNPALGVQRDSAGNLTAIGGFTYEYDAEGMMTKATPSMGNATVYRYDGEGRRVAKQTGTGPLTTYVYNAFGELAAESQTGGPPPDQPVGTHYLMTDHLGSTRLVTDASGNLVSRHDYLPFGEEINVGVGGRTTAMKYVLNEDLTHRFTGKERDTETGLDYFGARYLSSMQGRWTSPDQPFADQKVGNPQSWNLYSYVRNNPLGAIDPTGRDTYLLIWIPTADGVGHAAIAVSNYKQDAKTGKMVPDGTYSYRDQWPAQEVGKSNYDKDVKSAYQKKTVTEQELLKKDVSGGEGRPADGVVKLPTDAATDKKTLSALDGHEKSNPSYNGVKNNCSTFCSTGISTAAGKPVSAQETIKSPVPWLSDVKATTPNALWQGTTSLSGATVVKDPGAAAKKPFKVF